MGSHTEASKLSLMAERFDSIPGISKIFEQEEADAYKVYLSLWDQLRTTYNLIKAEQFCFLLVYAKSNGYSIASYRKAIRVNDQNLFLQVLNICLEMGIGQMLADALKEQTIAYPCGKLAGKFIQCDDWTLPPERVPEFILKWCDSDEKVLFLKELGVRDKDSNDIQRRMSFMDNKYIESLWNITDRNILVPFLDWVRTAIPLPVKGEAQNTILKKIWEVLNYKCYYYEEDFSDASEWSNELYLKWKATKELTIKLIPGLLPCRGIYSNAYFFKDYIGDFDYFDSSKTLYISKDKEPASILTDVYTKYSKVFSKDDWNQIFLVSASIVKDKDEKIAELERKIEELKRRKSVDEDDVEVDEHGEAVDRDYNDPKVRAEINKQARYAAKEFLSSMSDYDCDEWDPEEEHNLITNKVKYKGKYIAVAVCSSLRRKLYLHPRLFAELMVDRENLLLNYGADRRIHSLSFNEIFKGNPNVNLIFDTDVISPSEMAHLANKYMYSKRTCFVIENPKYSQSDTIKSFGLDEKMEDGKVGIFDESDIFKF